MWEGENNESKVMMHAEESRANPKKCELNHNGTGDLNRES